MIRFSLFLFLCFAIFTGCKTKYATKEFKNSQLPVSPNYNNLESWAAHPEKNDSIIDIFYTAEKENLKADVFYIYPTLLTNKKNDAWNSDVFDENQNNKVKNIAIKYQASAWANAGRIYSPLYRQVHYRSFFEPYTSNGGIKAGEIALGPNTGSKYYLTSDENVDIVKKLLKSWNNMDPDGMFEVLEDTITWYVASEKKPIVADKNFIVEYMSAYDSISQVVQGYIPHQYEGQTPNVVSVASRETKFKKDGTVEDDRLFERFFIRNGKIFRVMAWSAVWNTN